jgi:uncharacterized protein YbaR (Trm112 family)
MEDLTGSAQSKQHLDLLLEHLACPLDNSIPLKPVHNPAGRVVALRAQNREYPVVNNIPCLIPDLDGQDKSFALWQTLQHKLVKRSQDPSERVFSTQDDRIAPHLGQILSQTERGLFLDVGCGALPQPSYMDTSNGSITWTGIDPIFGDVARQFPFAQALGEYLPFRPQIFDGLLYGSVLRDILDPLRSFRRARSILKPEAKLYVWYTISRVDARYVVWKNLQALGLTRPYSDRYRWAYTHRSVRNLLREAGFAIEQVIPLCEACPDYAACEMPTEFLAVARCVRRR